jgi:hypothetical protein
LVASYQSEALETVLKVHLLGKTLAKGGSVYGMTDLSECFNDAGGVLKQFLNKNLCRDFKNGDPKKRRKIARL